MKYFILIWAGLWRKKVRTILTMLSIVIAFFLFGLLQGVNQGMNAVYQQLDVDRLYVQSRINLTDGLPISYLERIKAVPGVRAVTYWTYFGGFYRDARNALAAYAADVAAQFAAYPYLKIPQDQLETMIRTRTGTIVSDALAAKYGWKIGDRIAVGTSIWTAKDGASTYELELVGIFSGATPGGPAFYINYDYFDATRAFGNGAVHTYVVSVSDPRRGSEVAAAIDALFANSAFETRTQTEQAYAQTTIKQIGDISLVMNAIVGAVLFTLLFLTCNTMMQSVSERVPELAVLKTLGYSDGKVLTLVIVESVMLCTFASLIGLMLARIAFSGLRALFGTMSLPLLVMQTGIGMAVALALISGLLPAWRAKRLNIVDALAGR